MNGSKPSYVEYIYNQIASYPGNEDLLKELSRCYDISSENANIKIQAVLNESFSRGLQLLDVPSEYYN